MTSALATRTWFAAEIFRKKVTIRNCETAWKTPITFFRGRFSRRPALPNWLLTFLRNEGPWQRAAMNAATISRADQHRKLSAKDKGHQTPFGNLHYPHCCL
jgi:hypothetical protein